MQIYKIFAEWISFYKQLCLSIFIGTIFVQSLVFPFSMSGPQGPQGDPGQERVVYSACGCQPCDSTRWTRYTTWNPHATSRTDRDASMLEWNEPIDGKSHKFEKSVFYSFGRLHLSSILTPLLAKQLKPSGSADGNMIAAACAIHITVLGILYMQVPFSVVAFPAGPLMAKFLSIKISTLNGDWVRLKLRCSPGLRRQNIRRRQNFCLKDRLPAKTMWHHSYTTCTTFPGNLVSPTNRSDIAISSTRGLLYQVHSSFPADSSSYMDGCHHWVPCLGFLWHALVPWLSAMWEWLVKYWGAMAE